MVTVKGENLASVSRYLMQIRAVYKSNTTLSASVSSFLFFFVGKSGMRNYME